MYRVAEVRWSRGAHKRGTQRPEYVLLRINRNKVAFGRNRDYLLTPSPVNNIKKERHLPMEQVLTGRTPQGYRLLENRDWEVARVKPEEIAEHLRGRKEVFEKLPKADVLECKQTMLDIVSGKLSGKILRDYGKGLTPKHIQWVKLAPNDYYFDINGFFDADFLQARVKPPASFAELLDCMKIMIEVDGRTLLEPEHHAELFFVLAHLRSVLFRMQKKIDRTKVGIAFQLPTISITGEIVEMTKRVNELWIKSMLDESGRRLREVITPAELLKVRE